MITRTTLGGLITLFAAAALTSPRLAAQEAYLRGDVNSDGEVTISDGWTLLRSLFTRGFDLPDCLDARDANGDGRVNVADPVSILTGLFGRHPDSKLPGSASSALGCNEYGTGKPLEDPVARLTVLSARPDRGRVTVVLGASHSRAVAGHSFSLRLPDEILTDAEPLATDLTGTSTEPFASGHRDGDTFSHGFLPAIVPSPSFPTIPATSEVAPIYQLVIGIRKDIAAGEYPVELIAGELIDAASGRAIKPHLESGTIRIGTDLTANGDRIPAKEKFRADRRRRRPPPAGQTGRASPWPYKPPHPGVRCGRVFPLRSRWHRPRHRPVPYASARDCGRWLRSHHRGRISARRAPPCVRLNRRLPPQVRRGSCPRNVQWRHGRGRGGPSLWWTRGRRGVKFPSPVRKNRRRVN